MSYEKVRLVGGGSAGEIIEWDREKSGPVIRVPKHPDFNTCVFCADGQDYPDKAMAVHVDVYRIQDFHYSTGHRHSFAAPDNMRAVDIFNVLWQSYVDSNKKPLESDETRG